MRKCGGSEQERGGLVSEYECFRQPGVKSLTSELIRANLSRLYEQALPDNKSYFQMLPGP